MSATTMTGTDLRWTDYSGAMAITRQSRSTILRLVKEGKIKARKIGRRVLFSVAELNALVDTGASA